MSDMVHVHSPLVEQTGLADVAEESRCRPSRSRATRWLQAESRDKTQVAGSVYQSFDPDERFVRTPLMDPTMRNR